MNLSIIQTFAIWVIPVLFAITLHEVSHGWVANYYGDPTAKMLGRLTINPVKHIDLIGTIIVPTILLFLGGFIFGWAKPVPVTYQNLHNPKRDMAIVAAAGPIANLTMAIFWTLIAKIGITIGKAKTMIAIPMILMGRAGIIINVILMILNLFPLPPLDGSRVVSAFLPDKLAWQYSRLEPYGFFILLGLLAFGILGKLLGPLVYGMERWLLQLFGVI